MLTRRTEKLGLETNPVISSSTAAVAVGPVCSVAVSLGLGTLQLGSGLASPTGIEDGLVDQVEPAGDDTGVGA